MVRATLRENQKNRSHHSGRNTVMRTGFAGRRLLAETRSRIKNAGLDREGAGAKIPERGRTERLPRERFSEHGSNRRGADDSLPRPARRCADVPGSKVFLRTGMVEHFSEAAPHSPCTRATHGDHRSAKTGDPTKPDQSKGAVEGDGVGNRVRRCSTV